MPALAVGCFLAAAVSANLSMAADPDPGGVSGCVFLDKNADGRHEEGETGFASVGVALFGHTSDGTPFYLTSQTDERGCYAFSGDAIGPGSTFRVTTGGAPLDYLIPAKYPALRMYFVATNGNDRNPGTREQPYRTIAQGVRVLRAGDVLYIRGGEYREYVTSLAHPIAGGESWDRPVVVAGMPGERVVIRPPADRDKDLLVNLTYQRQKYIIIANLVLDAEDATLPFKSQSRDGHEPPPCHIRVVNCELLHAKGSAAFMVGEDHQFINCRIHDNGHSKKDHGLYVSSPNSLIQGCDIYFNSGWGVHVYNGSAATADDVVIRGNRIHDNDTCKAGCPAIGIHSGKRDLIYDNVIWGRSYNPVVVSIQGAEARIYNNTIYGSESAGIAIMSEDQTHGNIARNNIVSTAYDPPIHCESKSSQVDHNFVEGDPRFRDAEGLDFHLLPHSPAITAGVEVPEVRYDYDGLPRPQGKPYCLGAYEYGPKSFSPTTRQKPEVYVAGKKFEIDIGFALFPNKAS